MKKLLTFVLALSMVASTCLYAQAVKKNKPKTKKQPLSALATIDICLL